MNKANNQQSSPSQEFELFHYLGTEGFLPGYGFPKLPVYAFLELPGGNDNDNAMIIRPRTIAIREFAPYALIYSEGNTYQCTGLRFLGMGENSGIEDRLKKNMSLCKNCFCLNENEKQEECVHCKKDSNTYFKPMEILIEMEAVQAVPTRRITSNDEEREKHKNNLKTYYKISDDDGQLKAKINKSGPYPIDITYLPQANLYIINKEAYFNENTHRWVSEEKKKEEEKKEGAKVIQVRPFVRDNKNAFILDVKAFRRDDTKIITLKYALIKAMIDIFDIEEDELMGEVLETEEKGPQKILFYEASEGGSGILKTLFEGDDAIPAEERWSLLAQAALKTMHIEKTENGTWQDTEDACINGCYKCLFSYFNQVDQDNIDRSSEDIKNFFISLLKDIQIDVKGLKNIKKQSDKVRIQSWDEIDGGSSKNDGKNKEVTTPLQDAYKSAWQEIFDEEHITQPSIEEGAFKWEGEKVVAKFGEVIKEEEYINKGYEIIKISPDVNEQDKQKMRDKFEVMIETNKMLDL